MSERQRLSRANGDLPQIEGAELLHRRLDVILFAHGYAAGGQHQVRGVSAMHKRGAGSKPLKVKWLEL